ncbi:MAG: hypothetical protein A2W25_01755 [candidate division Zixibacteria bacterium RBG_16_53_22]|nr:MAG: hypothetical protein A2W25_01755 [candidate division Zixibacteria bacterium RBG_16_53_22]
MSIFFSIFDLKKNGRFPQVLKMSGAISTGANDYQNSSQGLQFDPPFSPNPLASVRTFAYTIEGQYFREFLGQ